MIVIRLVSAEDGRQLIGITVGKHTEHFAAGEAASVGAAIEAARKAAALGTGDPGRIEIKSIEDKSADAKAAAEKAEADAKAAAKAEKKAGKKSRK